MLRLLEKCGYHADVAANGRLAYQAVQQKHYEAVLMDCQMPEMDGFEVTRLIRPWEQEQHEAAIPRLSIIAVTANTLAGDRERCLQAGMDDYLQNQSNCQNFASCWPNGRRDSSTPRAQAA